MSYPGNNQPQQPYPPQYGQPQYQQQPRYQPPPGYQQPQYQQPQYQQPPFQHPPQQPQYGPPKKGKGGMIVAVLVVALLLVGGGVVFALGRAGVIDGVPLAGGVPSVPPPAEMPGAVGGLYRLDGKEPMAFKAGGAKYDWAVAKYYATKPENHADKSTPVYVVTIYGPLGKAKDALSTRNNIVDVGSGSCADGTPSVPLRVCAVQRGSIVATVTDSSLDGKRTATDDELIAYSASFANALS